VCFPLQALGSDHADLAGLQTHLGNMHVKTGNPKDGIPLLQRALFIRRKALGEEHPLVATTNRDIGSVIRPQRGWIHAQRGWIPAQRGGIVHRGGRQEACTVPQEML
jgi:hypothetical protein